jgi:Arc/MetJ-type ribon-helix-helix transcriptional regulator
MTMSTINISLPQKLKEQAEVLIGNGYYASFSDLVRTALREAINKHDNSKNYTEIKISK